MNTLIITPSTQSLFTRFAWKEYRMLRGFWLAGFVISFVLQWFLATVASIPGTQEEEVFTIAWAAAALYGVGAAITMFCAETEERTRDYLRLLPGDWRPIFATKIFMSLVSAILLACALSLTGWWLAGYHWPESRQMQLTFAMLGVAIFEGLAWGVLFSLWWKQPLVAAVAAIACASLGTQFAVGLSAHENVFSSQAYRAALSARLVICAAVFLLDVWLGKQWLYPKAQTGRKENAVAKPASGLKAATSAAGQRRKMYSRLLWQTWRESWRMIFIALPLSFLMIAAFMVPAYTVSTYNYLRALPFVALILPALLGALTFRADQQSDHRLFLATHAVKPRRVWLARQAIWLSVVIILCGLFQLIGSSLMQSTLSREVTHYLESGWAYYPYWLGTEYSLEGSSWTHAWQFEHMRANYERAVLVAWTATLTAYGVGQLCSMALRQSLLSGFLAILLSVVIGAWAVLMFLWEMNSQWFVLPLGIATLAATWLRMPSWILGKNRLKQWVAPAVVVAATLVLTLDMVPGERLAQVSRLPTVQPFLGNSFDEAQQRFNNLEQAAGPTALAYERLAAELNDADAEFLRHSMFVHTDLMPESIREAAEKAVQLSLKPECRFTYQQVVIGSEPGKVLLTIHALLDADAKRLERNGDLDAAFERLAARLRLTGQMLNGQTSGHFTQILWDNWKSGIAATCEQIVDWANHEDQTSERIKAAIREIETIQSTWPQPTDALYVDFDEVRRILLDEAPPTHPNWLLLVLSRLPGEQERGLMSVEQLTRQAMNYANAVKHLAAGQPIRSWANPNREVNHPRDLLRHGRSEKSFAVEELASNGNVHFFNAASRLATAAASSFLAVEEFNSTGSLLHLLRYWVDTETRIRALQLRLALIAYRIDHGEYPAKLNELVPDYLPTMIRDPYSNKPFVYRPQGLKLPLVHNAVGVGGSFRKIAANTPLLWSVRNDYSKLQEVTEPTEQPEDDGTRTAIRPEEWQTVFKFEDTENLVFLLPK